MILEFADNSQIVVHDIFGGPINVDGVMRDSLTIEIPMNGNTIDGLTNTFKDTQKLTHLYTYEKRRNDRNKLVDTKIEIGEGYTIVLGINRSTRKVKTFPGRLLPNRTEDIYKVRLAQLTYEEWIKSEYNTKSSSDESKSN